VAHERHFPLGLAAEQTDPAPSDVQLTPQLDALYRDGELLVN
jgi:hypothetical protein